MKFLLLLLLAVSCWGQDFDGLREFIRTRLRDDTVPSVAVAVARDGKILFEEGFGWANREQRVPADAHTPYSLASISKPITATGLMVLVERGKVDLDAPINRYLGPAPLVAKVGEAPAATVRRVASHTAGLPLHYQFFYDDELRKPPSMEETIRRYGILVTPPGERYEYSNLGFGILDHVITRTGGKAYGDFMREEVFAPLGLTNTAIGIPPGAETRHAVRYGTDQLPIPFYDFDHRGASAVYASAHDLVRFGMFHLKAHLADQKQILKDTSIDRMQQSEEAGGKTAQYGIGWSVADRGGLRVVSHSGGMGGVSTLLTLIPSEKVAIAVLCNARSSLPGAVSMRVRELLKVKAPASQQQTRAEDTFRPPAPWVRTWKGKLVTHSGEQAVQMTIHQGGDVHVRLGTSLWTLLNQVSYRDGYLRGVLDGDVKTEDASRLPHVVQVTLRLRGDVLCGPASAVSKPGKRAGNALTSWLELR
ncbi:MAG: beta-lactamase family protein [Acidobacteria bacterium]|nr:beta-lactamase family protein [Acidobacteriota bacterium]